MALSEDDGPTPARAGEAGNTSTSPHPSLQRRGTGDGRAGMTEGERREDDGGGEGGDGNSAAGLVFCLICTERAHRFDPFGGDA